MDEVWLDFFCKCALQAILLDAVTDLNLFRTLRRDASIQWPLDHINPTRVRRLSIEGCCSMIELHLLDSMGLFGASSDGVATKAEAIPVKLVQARQLFDESESMREWVLQEEWQGVLEESDDCAELIS